MPVAPRLMRSISPLAAVLLCLTLPVGPVGCGGPPKPVADGLADRELTNAIAGGQQALARGSPDLAIEQFHRALNRARRQDDAATIGDQAFNLAIACMSAGRLADAAISLNEAEAALRRADLPLADVLLVRVQLLHSKSEGAATKAALAAAEAAALRVLNDPKSRPASMHRLAVAVLRAEIACDQADTPAAVAMLDMAKAIVDREPTIGGASGIARVAGRLALLHGDPAAAARSFDEEARLQKQAHRFPEMARALSNAGQAYLATGATATAADRMLRSATSWQGQEKKPQAAAALNAARAAAKSANSLPLIERIDEFAREVEALPDVAPATTAPAASAAPATSQRTTPSVEP